MERQPAEPGKVTAARELELAAEAGSSVARVKVWLERPSVETFDRATAELAGAASHIGLIHTAGPVGGAKLKATLRELRKDLGSLALLMRRAWEMRARRGGQAAYTNTGELAPQIISASRWSLEG